MNAWVAYPMHEVGVRRWEPPMMSKKEKARIWALILAWLTCLGILLALFAFGEVEAAEFTEKMVLVEVDGNVQLAMLALDEKAMARAANLGCVKGKLRKKQITFDFTDPVLPTLYVVYVCGEQTTKQ